MTQHHQIEVVFPESVKPFVKMQANDDFIIYRDPPYFPVVAERVRAYNPAVALELGAGVGRMSHYFFKKFGWLKTFFYLQDGDSGDEQYGGIRGSIEDEYYNSFQAATDFCQANGMTHFELIHQLAKVTKPVDFVYSFAAIGFHWHINLYLDQLPPLLAEGAKLLFEIRAPIDAEEDAHEKKRIDFQEFFDDQVNYAQHHAAYTDVEIVDLKDYTGYRYKERTHFLLMSKK
ncbi:MAG: hypothetical protein N2D54_10960 [Chloroflexota bacterium]